MFHTHVVDLCVISDISIIFRFNSIWCGPSLQTGNRVYVCICMREFFFHFIFYFLCGFFFSGSVDSPVHISDWTKVIICKNGHFEMVDKIQLPICIRFIIRGSMLNAH